MKSEKLVCSECGKHNIQTLRDFNDIVNYWWCLNCKKNVQVTSESNFKCSEKPESDCKIWYG